MEAYKEVFAGQNLYAVLGVDKAAPAEAIKKAYFKKALIWVRRDRGRATRGEGALGCPLRTAWEGKTRRRGRGVRVRPLSVRSGRPCRARRNPPV